MRTGFESLSIGGTTIQAGVRTSPPARFYANTEAVVLKVYYPDQEDRIDGQTTITCDVRTIGRSPRHLSRVPVLQLQAGLFDEDTWVPRAAAQAIDGSTLQVERCPTDAEGGDKVSPTPAELMDGDRVLVGFFEGSVARPFIWPIGVPHPNARNTAQSTNGRRRRIRHHGSLLEFDDAGNVTIDGRGAAKEELGARGTEVSNSGVGGKVLLITKDGSAAETKTELDEQGNIRLVGPTGSVTILKSGTLTIQSPTIKHSASSLVEVTAGATFKVTAPAVDIYPTATYAIHSSIPFGIALGFGGGQLDSLVKFNMGWLPFWTSIMTSAGINDLVTKYDPTKQPPPPSTVGEVVMDLLGLWLAIQAAYNTHFAVGPVAAPGATQITKAT